MTGQSLNRLRLVWIYDGSLSTAMDSATWLRIVEELRSSGWQVNLLAAGSSGLHQIRGVEVLCIERPNIYLLRQIVFHLKVLYYIVKQWTKIDIIIVHEISAPWVLLLRPFRYLTGKHQPIFVMDTRSLPMSHPKNETWRDKARRYAYKIFVQIGNRYADGRLAITQRMAKAVYIPTEKLWGIWPSGATPGDFSLSRTNRHWPLPTEAVHLIYHGSLHHERNLLALCKAVVKANQGGELFLLSLVGEGTQRLELESFAAQAKDIIHVTAPVLYDKVPELLGQAHVGVLPFPDEEKFRVSSPIKLFEYMAAGLPVLVTKITCHTDVVESGGYAFWAESGSEEDLLKVLHLIWHSRNLLGVMGEKAAIASEAWTWAASAEKLTKALEIGANRFGIRPHEKSDDIKDSPVAGQIGD